jgi:cell division protein FtsQ
VKEEKGTPRPLQDVVYTPPKPFLRNRLLLRLATVFAIVLALVLAMSVFFRVEHIQVSGMDQYTAWEISQASGISEGDSLFSLELPGAAARIMELDYVKDVRISIRLPNMVLIEVTEVRVSYAIKGAGEDWWLVNSNGRITAKAEKGTEDQYTKILGIQLDNPKEGEQAKALETTAPGVDENGGTIPVTVTDANRLSTTFEIMDYLERNSIIGQAKSIDVRDLGNLEFWYGEQYQVKLGDANQLLRKISLIKGAIDKFSSESHNSGVLEVRLNNLAIEEDDEVKYTRFQ